MGAGSRSIAVSGDSDSETVVDTPEGTENETEDQIVARGDTGKWNGYFLVGITTMAYCVI